METYIKYRLNIGDNLRTIYKKKDINKIEIGCTNYSYNDAIDAIRLKYGDEKLFKEMVSKSVFSLRAPYGKHNEDFKRLAILCGTSNEYEIMNDPTGNNLSDDVNSSVRFQVARNQNTTPKTLDKLRKTKNIK